MALADLHMACPEPWMADLASRLSSEPEAAELLELLDRRQLEMLCRFLGRQELLFAEHAATEQSKVLDSAQLAAWGRDVNASEIRRTHADARERADARELQKLSEHELQSRAWGRMDKGVSQGWLAVPPAAWHMRGAGVRTRRTMQRAGFLFVM